MEEQFPMSPGRSQATDSAAENEMELLLRWYPELDCLEPYDIAWEFIWPM